MLLGPHGSSVLEPRAVLYCPMADDMPLRMRQCKPQSSKPGCTTAGRGADWELMHHHREQGRFDAANGHRGGPRCDTPIAADDA